jgi:hypothetical protein
MMGMIDPAGTEIVKETSKRSLALGAEVLLMIWKL